MLSTIFPGCVITYCRFSGVDNRINRTCRLLTDSAMRSEGCERERWSVQSHLWNKCLRNRPHLPAIRIFVALGITVGLINEIFDEL